MNMTANEIKKALDNALEAWKTEINVLDKRQARDFYFELSHNARANGFTVTLDKVTGKHTVTK